MKRKKNWLFRDCRSYSQFEQRAAEWFVCRDIKRTDYARTDENELTQWRGYRAAFRELFGDGDFEARVQEIRDKVNEVGVENYHWGWIPRYYFTD